MRYLVDSDWLIDAAGGKPSAVRTLERLSARGLAVSIIAVAEVYEGAFGLAAPETMLASFRSSCAIIRPYRSLTRSSSALLACAPPSAGKAN